MKKQYVIDTNVLIHDPDCIEKFEEHTLIIPYVVISELDHLKTKKGQAGYGARKASKKIRDILEKSEPTCGVNVEGVSSEGQNGGHIKFLNPKVDALSARNTIKSLFRDPEQPDNQIIILTKILADDHERSNTKTILVTKDTIMACKAKLIGIAQEDYKHDKVKNSGKDHPILEIPFDDEFLYSNPQATLHTEEKLAPYSYVIIQHEGLEVPARHTENGVIVPIRTQQELFQTTGRRRHQKGLKIEGGAYIKPKNPEQTMLLDAIRNPDIDLVTVNGMAGSGKTFVTLAASLEQVLDNKTPFEHMLISRTNEELGNTIGLLPGDESDKIGPYMRGYMDNLKQLCKPTNQHKEEESGKNPYQWLFDTGVITIEAVNFIRGRSIPGVIFLMDECQNITPHIIQTIITRMAENSKIILMGDLDPSQIDNLYMDSESNGLAHVINRFQGEPSVAHINLRQGVRSRLATLAAQKLKT